VSLVAITFLLGCALIIVSIVGGGITVKEISLPALGRGPRALAAAFGVILIAMALAKPELLGSGSESRRPEQPSGGIVTPVPTGPAPELSRTAPTGQTVWITSNLADEQAFERTEVYLGGRKLGEFALDRTRRSGILKITATGKQEDYYLRATLGVAIGSNVQVYEVEGNGRIELQPGNIYSVSVAFEGEKPLSLFLRVAN
jgi:hypothetical protein